MSEGYAWLKIASDTDREHEDYDSSTPAELEVFDLDPDLLGDLYEAYNRYIDYLGIAGMDEEQAEKDRKKFPGYHAGENHGMAVFCNFKGAEFFRDACGLPYGQSYRYLVKIEMAQWRVGLIDYQGLEVAKKA